MEIKSQRSLLEVLSSGVVVTEPTRCVQCGICSFNCPAGIDIRKCAWHGDANKDNHCLACGQCVSRCPRGVPRFEKKSNIKKESQPVPNRAIKHNYMIIGTGPAGVSAAEAIHELEPESQITLVGDEDSGFYSRPGLAYYLTGELSERQLSLRQASKFRCIKTTISSIRPKEHQLIAENGKRLVYDKLLIATGSSASKICIPGIDLKGVMKLDNISDAKEMIRIARKTKSAVVIGGGITALEIVEGLVANGVETHYLLRSDRYWPNVLDPLESQIVETRLKSHGVYLHHMSQQSQILGEHGKVVGVETENGEKFQCQLVAVAVGVQPRIEVAKSAGLKVEKGILTDEFLKTSDDDIFAAGDVVQALDPVSGKTVMDSLWGNAVVQGRIAGKNMTGQLIPFRKSIPFNVTRLAGLTTTIIGTVGQGKDSDLITICRGDSETWRQLPDVLAVQCDLDINRTRILIGAKNIVGALVMGVQTLSRPLLELISNRVDISPIRESLVFSGSSFTDIVLDFWLDWSRDFEQA